MSSICQFLGVLLWDHPATESMTGDWAQPAGLVGGHRYGAPRQPGPNGQRQQPVPQLLIRERPRIVGQRDHLPQYRPCRAALLDRRGEAVKVGLRVDGGDRPVRAPGGDRLARSAAASFACPLAVVHPDGVGHDVRTGW
jgi:hypothetical protein